MKTARDHKFIRNKCTGVATLYSLQFGKDGSWRIGYGRSGFLVAEGSGFSRRIGFSLLRALEDEYWSRRKSMMRGLNAKA